ncbi:MAG: extracellular solute-binding protein [Chloroflexota bacterium]|nr:extracellular solute-binding protein [Chloroflexota bacterium]
MIGVQSARLSRRRVLGLAAGGVLAATAGCGGTSSDRQALVPTVVQVGTPPAAVPGFDEPGRWAGRTLRVGAWGGEVQAALRLMVWEPFARLTGCVIREVVTDYGALDRSLQGGDPYADVLVVDSMRVSPLAAQGAIQAGPANAALGVDLVPPLDGSVPAYAYGMVSAYRRETGDPDEAPESWEAWWDRDRFPGNRTLYKGPFGTFEFALMADGVAPDQLYPLDSERAIESLKRISGRIVNRWWESGVQPVTWLSRGQADFGSAWHYRVLAGQADGEPVGLVWDQGLLVADHWVVPAGAAVDLATDFLRFASTPEVQAALAQQVGLGPVVSGAFDHLDPLFVSTLPTAPENIGKLVRQDVAWWTANNVEANQQFNEWLLGNPDE